MLQQEVMIEKVRELCERDERVVAALMYGSFTLGQGDRFSDIEFYLFFEDKALEGLDEEAWVGQIAPAELYVDASQVRRCVSPAAGLRSAPSTHDCPHRSPGAHHVHVVPRGIVAETVRR